MTERTPRDDLPLERVEVCALGYQAVWPQVNCKGVATCVESVNGPEPPVSGGWDER